MKNKGEIRTITIVILVLVFFLAISLFGSSSLFANIQNRAETIIPVFGDSEQPFQQDQIIAFNIPENKVEFFDEGSQSWIPLPAPPDTEKLGDKKVSQEIIYQNLATNYYLNDDKRAKEKIHELDPRIAEKIYPPSNEDYLEIYNSLPFLKACVINNIFPPLYPEQKEDVRVSLIAESTQSCQSQTYGLIRVDLKETVLIARAEKEGNKITANIDEYEILQNQDAAQTMKEISQEWRDSILSQPVEINYIFSPDEDTNQPRSNSYCPEKIRTRLVINLRDPTTKDTC